MTNASQRILILDGHPDPTESRFVHALANAYATGALERGHEVKTVRISDLQFPALRSGEDFQHGQAPAPIAKVQDLLTWCTHLVVLYPLWLGSMPSVLKAFFEQALRPGFAFGAAKKQGLPKRLLAGRSARIVVTMGMPALFYRWYYRAHSLKSLERNILSFTGFRPIRATVIGNVETPDARKRTRWLEEMRALGGLAK